MQIFSAMTGDKNRLSSGPQNNLQRSNSMMGNDPSQFSNHPQGANQQSNESNMQFPTDAPNMPFGPNVPQNKMPNFMDQKPGDVSASRHLKIIHFSNMLCFLGRRWTFSFVRRSAGEFAAQSQQQRGHAKHEALTL
jgi:hypothetical protein